MTLKNKRTKNARLLFLTFAIFFSLPFTYSQNVISTSGTEFWLGFMQNVPGTSEMSIQISSEYNITGTISMPAGSYSQNFSVNANETTTILLPATAMHTVSTLIESKGILIETSDIASVYARNSVANSTDASLVLAKESLGNDYYITSYNGINYLTSGNVAPSEFLIVATEDNTEIELIPTADIYTIGQPTANVPINITLNRGESYLLKAAFTNGNLTGSSISVLQNSGNCKPIAVFSGNVCTNLPSSAWDACDHVFDQCLPTTSWGQNFVITPFLGITKYGLKILACEDNTNISIDGVVTTTLNTGQAYFNSFSNSHSISADKKINITQNMGSNDFSDSKGDPFITNLHDVNNLIKYSAFKTYEGIEVLDYTFHGLSIVSPTLSTGQIWLDGVQIDSTLFVQFPNNTNYSYYRQFISEGNHYISAPQGIQAFVYGYGNETYDSYGFQLGGRSVDYLNNVNNNPNGNLVCYSDSVTIGNINYPLQDTWWELGLNSNDTIISGNNYLTVLPDSSQTYILHGNLINSGCPITYVYNVLPSVIGEINFNIGTDSLCLFTDYQLNTTVIPMGNYKYEWQFSSGLSNDTILNPIINFSNESQYQLKVSTLDGCVVDIDTTNFLFKESNIYGLETAISANAACIGDTIFIDVFLEEISFSENFNSAIFNPIFDLYQGVSFSSYCDVYSSGTLAFNGSSLRMIRTASLDLTNTNAVNFSLMSIGSGNQCNETEVGDDLVLEYSIDEGVNWELIELYDQAQYHQHSNLHVLIPNLAKTASTKLRWRQTNNEGYDTDLWYLDNVQFTHLTNSGYIIDWGSNSDLILSNQGRSAKINAMSSSYLHFSYIDPVTNCSINDSVFVQFVPDFDIFLTPDFTTCVNSGNQVEVLHDSPETVNISWLPSGVFSNDSISNPTVTVSSDTTLYVSVMSASGCTKYDSLNIIVNGVNDFEIDLIGSSNLCNGDTLQSQLNFGVTTCITVPHESNGSFSSATIGTNNSATTGVQESPFPARLSSKRQIILKKSELESSGLVNANTINSIGFIVLGGNETYNNFTVKIGCTNLNNFSSGSVYIEDLETTINPRTVNIQPGNNIFLFDQDYRWDGISNLVFEICYENQSTPSACSIVYTNSPGSCMYSYGSSVCENESGGLGRRATIILGYAPIQTNFPTSYLWSPSTNISDPIISNPSFYPNTTTTYYVLATDNVTQCVYEDSITINVTNNSSYIQILEGDSLTICEGTNQSLSLNTNVSDLVWSNLNDSTSFNPLVSSSISKMYTVIGTIDSVCFVSDSIQVDVIIDSPIGFNSDTLYKCPEVPLLVETNNNTYDTYNWSNNTFGMSTLVNQSGWIILSASNSCWNNIDSIYIDVDSFSINLGFDTSFCEGEMVLLGDNLLQSVSNLWSTGDQSQTITTSTGGLFWLEAINSNGCIDRDTIIVTINPLPILNQISYNTYCTSDGLIQLTGSPSGGFYSGIGVVGDKFDPTNGTQILQYHYTDLNGCSDSIDQHIYVYSEPLIEAGEQVNVCLGDSTVLTASGGVSYVWNNSVIDGVPFLTYFSDYYVVIGTDANGCKNTDSVLVSVKYPVNTTVTYNPPNLSAVYDSENISYEWVDCSDGSTVGNTIVYTPLQSGDYAVIIIDYFNCTDTSDCYNINFAGIEDNTKNNFGIYPNPTTGKVIFDFQGESVMINIYDSKGKLVLESQKIEQNQSIDISNYADGIYTIKIESKSQTFYSRITKQQY